MVKTITDIETLIQLQESLPLLDVRAPIEFLQGHIPKAINFPILNNEERKLVGTCYKQQGHEAAVILGYKLVGPQFYEHITRAYKQFPEKKIIIHCYRGGLRSKIMANLLSSAGFEVHLLQGGYKKFRHWVLEKLSVNYQFKVLGGYTGSGKTSILNQLEKQQKPVIDLEALASHRGSAFGNIGLPAQPTNEQFENRIACKLQTLDTNNAIWIEDECSMIGKCKVPQKIYESMRNSHLLFLTIPFEIRLQNIIADYGNLDKELLKMATLKLYKRLGDLRTKKAIELLEENKLNEWATIILEYYDKTYEFGASKRAPSSIKNIDLQYFEQESSN